jgi:5-methylcytosine-specific restriction protein A
MLEAHWHLVSVCGRPNAFGFDTPRSRGLESVENGETLPPMPHRPEVHRWYCTAGWQRRRAHQLMIEPLCRLCLEAGRVTPATVADHVEPHRGDLTAFRLGQLRSLCADCHNRLDANNAPRAPVREDGTPSDPRHPWNARAS